MGKTDVVAGTAAIGAYLGLAYAVNRVAESANAPALRPHHFDPVALVSRIALALTWATGLPLPQALLSAATLVLSGLILVFLTVRWIGRRWFGGLGERR